MTKPLTDRQIDFQANPKDPRHGTTNGYSNLMCRCQKCRDAWAEYCLNRQYQRAKNPIPEHVHGTENGYGNYRCRCRPCTDAWTSGVLGRRKRAA